MGKTWTLVNQVPGDTIVVGWDGSRHSMAALAWAVDHARGEHRPITVVHAMSPQVAGDAAVWTTEDELREVGADLLAEVSTHLDGHARDVAVGVLVVSGQARNVLRELSSRAAMVVVGSHGRGPVTSKALGSVSVAVVWGAACPVVVVRLPEPAAVRRGVLAAVGFDAAATAVAEFAFHEASVLRLPLTVFHSIPEHASWVAVANAERHLSEFLAGLREDFPEVHCTARVVRGDTRESILEHSRDHHLTVVGSPTRKRPLRSTTTSRLIERAHNPVAVVPVGPPAEDPSSREARRPSNLGSP